MITDKYETAVVSNILKLFKNYGFRRYRLESFEKYSLYQENKDFLLAKNVIAFSDLNGELMAMRPDVTLSVIKHNDIPTEGIDKLYYNEKVYRQASGGRNYREINQTGVELFGCVDEVAETEVVMIALQTLNLVGDEYLLDISHMDFVEGLLSEFPSCDKEELLFFLQHKDIHDYLELAKKRGYDGKLNEAFEASVNTCGDARKILKSIKNYCLNERMKSAVYELSRLCDRLVALGYSKEINVNFSATGNENYYNGIIFNGYINGVPHCVLSGGRYDKLIEKLNKNGSAVGFALYLGELERYFKQDEEYVDYLIVYDKQNADRALGIAKNYARSNRSVRLSPVAKSSIKYNELIDLRSRSTND